MIAGALLGIPKAAAALLSGEMKDTSHLGMVNVCCVWGFVGVWEDGGVWWTEGRRLGMANVCVVGREG